MSTRYFILTKTASNQITDNTDDQIIFPNKISYLLPRINLEYYSQNGLFENQLIEWTKQLCSPDKVFLDIGAHTGTYTLSLANLCKHVYSFEPQKMTYYALCGSIALSNLQNVTCLQTGLGSSDQTGKAILKIVSDDGGGSSIHATDGILKEEEIQIYTLDHFQIVDIGFIKMDVEENELSVLHGAVETLRRSNYPKILFESNSGDSSEEGRALFSFLSELGYRIIKLNGYHNMYLAEQELPPPQSAVDVFV